MILLRKLVDRDLSVQNLCLTLRILKGTQILGHLWKYLGKRGCLPRASGLSGCTIIPIIIGQEEFCFFDTELWAHHDEYWEMTLSLEKWQMASLFLFIWMLSLKSYEIFMYTSSKVVCWQLIVVVYFSFKALHPWSLILFCFSNCYKEVNRLKLQFCQSWYHY